MEVEVVYLVKLERVDQVYPHQPVFFNFNRVMHVVEGYGVYSIEVILSIKICVKTIHYHDHFICRRPWRLGIDDIHAVQTMCYMLF